MTEPKKSIKARLVERINRWMYGQWIVNHVVFVFFLSILAIVHIGNGHYTDNTIRNIGKAQTLLKQQQYEYKTLKAELLYKSRESEIAQSVEKFGLKKLSEPPVNIAQSK